MHTPPREGRLRHAAFTPGVGTEMVAESPMPGATPPPTKNDASGEWEESLPSGGREDLRDLSFLNEDAIVANLRRRFGISRSRKGVQKHVYTSCTGGVLLAVNPYVRACPRLIRVSSLHLAPPAGVAFPQH